MRSRLVPLAAAGLLALGLYGLLRAAEPPRRTSTDPWLDAFLAAGLRAEFRSASDAPEEDLSPPELRERFRLPGLRRSPLRHYLVQQAGVQILRLPAADALEDLFPPGRTPEHKLKEDGRAFHVARRGRDVLVADVFSKWVPFAGRAKLPRKTLDRIFEAFEEAAAQAAGGP